MMAWWFNTPIQHPPPQVSAGGVLRAAERKRDAFQQGGGQLLHRVLEEGELQVMEVLPACREHSKHQRR